MEAKMARTTFAAVAVLVCGMAMVFSGAAAAGKVYKKTFRSPGFALGPGSVVDQFYTVEMPQGHIAIRSFNAQVVDEHGVLIPLYETYLHHWVLHRYYTPNYSSGLRQPITASNWGPCQEGNLRQLFGLGSETRQTATEIPAPYGIVVGDPDEVPTGYEEIWVLNVHAIDTRGAVDKRMCFECLCEAYNITIDPLQEHKIPLPENYVGGLECCRDEAQCAVEPEFKGPKRTLFMEYYVEWVEMSDDVVPVNVYILDVTDGRTSVSGRDSCLVEFLVPQCAEGEAACVHEEENGNFLAKGGDIIYGVAHQHTGGIGSTLYNEDGEELCNSIPTYGDGNEPGNELGYITGMSTCYPQPGTKKIRGFEKLRLKSWYNNEVQHTGVMGLFYLLVDESSESEPKAGPHYWVLVVAALLAAVILIGGIVANHIKRKRSAPEYERISA